MGGYGTYLGWGIRKARLEGGEAPVGLAGASHPLMMSLMFLFFLLGAQGGLLFTLYEGRDLLASPHATSGYPSSSSLALFNVCDHVAHHVLLVHLPMMLCVALLLYTDDASPRF